nr:unnamed protein product [Digitaria exilis]
MATRDGSSSHRFDDGDCSRTRAPCPAAGDTPWRPFHRTGRGLAAAAATHTHVRVACRSSATGTLHRQRDCMAMRWGCRAAATKQPGSAAASQRVECVVVVAAFGRSAAAAVLCLASFHSWIGHARVGRRVREGEGKEQAILHTASDMEDQFQDGKEEVIQAWYMDDSEEDQRLPHHREPKEYIPLDKLSELGILSWRLNADDWENDENLKKIREARGYSYMDICDVCPEKLPNYEAKLKDFFEEHLHTDEEIRYCLEGSGYFDVRDQNDQWIRIAVKKGGMIVLPAGMYHRFTLDTNNYIKMMMLNHEAMSDLSTQPYSRFPYRTLNILQCVSLWESLSGRHTIVPMTISLLGRSMLRESSTKVEIMLLKLVEGGFRKIDPDRWEFANKGFLRGQRHLLKMIKRRRPPSYLPGSHQQQQQGLGSCLEVGQFGGGGLDEEMDRLKRDKNILLAEVVKLRQEQQSTRADMRAMEERLQHAEHKQVQMMGFLARAMQNPDFFQHLLQHHDQRKELDDAFSEKKRRRPIDAAPFEAAAGDGEAAAAPPMMFRADLSAALKR